MFNHFKHTTAITILAASLLTTGCSDTDARVTATSPSALQFGGSPIATISPALVSAEFVGRPSCPDVHPLQARANLLVQAGDGPVFVSEIRMRFIDTSGLTAPQVTLTAPQLMSQFGTALVMARSPRTFPLHFRFGCGTGRAGTLIVFVDTRDEHGRDRSTEIRVGVK